MNNGMLVRLIKSGGKMTKTARGREVVKKHYDATLKRMNSARGPQRDKLKREANAIAYAYNKATAGRR